MSRMFVLTRDVTPDECEWLDETIPQGRICVEFTGATYGCITPEGVAVSFTEGGGNPFVELPLDALREAT